MDVESLHMNIVHSEGLEALSYYLDKRNSTTPPTAFIVALTTMFSYSSANYSDKLRGRLWERHTPPTMLGFFSDIGKKGTSTATQILSNNRSNVISAI